MIFELTLFSLVCVAFAATFVGIVTLISLNLEKSEHRKKRNVIKIIETSITNKNANRKN